MSELAEAMRRFDERKEAVLSGEERGTFNDETMRLALSGFDLDLEELRQATRAVTMRMLDAVVNSDAPLRVVSEGTWIDGLITGLMLARIREEAEDG